MKNVIALSFVSFLIGSAAQAQVGAPEPVSPRPVTPPAVSDVPPVAPSPAEAEKKSAEENKDAGKDATAKAEIK